MLYNPDWDKIDNLVGWLETKNPEETYRYSSTTNCLLSQYVKDNGFDLVVMGNRDFVHSGFKWWNPLSWFGFSQVQSLPEGFDSIAIGYIEYDNTTLSPGWNFGEALARAKYYQAAA